MTVCLVSPGRSSTSLEMVSVTAETVFLCLATVVACCQLIGGTAFAGGDREEVAVAEERIFKGKKSPLLDKKKVLSSLFTRTAQPQVVHALSPIEHYPIWKVHKYKGIELRPVQVVDVPSPFDYSPVQAEYHQPAAQYGVPAVEPVRVPHTEYGVPAVDYSSFTASASGIAKPEEPTRIVTGGGDFQFQAPVTAYQGFHHGGKLKALLGFLRSHGGLLSTLRNLKSWKLGSKRGPALLTHGAPLPEVHEIPVKGLEHLNLQVPELPAIALPSYTSAVTGGPYVKLQIASATPALTYGTPVYQPQYAPRYEYQYPPQYSPEFSVSDQYGPPTQSFPARAPAPYYGAPPLFDSYGMPLPADAYSTAPSDQVLSFAVPENLPQSQQVLQLSDQTPEKGDEFNANNSTLSATAEKAEESPAAKFFAEENGNEDEEVTTVGGQQPLSIQTNI